MAIRTTKSTVTFASPFRLKGLPEAQPTGVYYVETDEAIIEGNDRVAYHRVATLLHLVQGGTTRTHMVDPEELQAALTCEASVRTSIDGEAEGSSGDQTCNPATSP